MFFRILEYKRLVANHSMGGKEQLKKSLEMYF